MCRSVSRTGSFMTILSLCAASIAAQTTGQIEGRTLNLEGAALANVVVSVTSTNLQGERSSTSDQDGVFRLIDLPPGTYRLRSALTGFQDLEVEEIRLNLDSTVRLELRLSSAIEDEVTVVAVSPTVDLSSTTTGQSFREDFFTQLPIGRTFTSVTFLTPGVTGGGYGSNPSVRGASAAENRYVIDGLDTTDTGFGTLGGDLAFQFIEEVEVKTGGYQAEYAGAPGGFVNVITKSGSNEFRGSVFGYYENDSFSSKSKAEERFDQQRSEFEDWDIGLGIGGKIIADKLWYFVSLNPGVYRAEETSVQGVAFSPRTESLDYAGKLSWQITPNQRLVGSVFGDPAKTTDDGYVIAAGRIGHDYDVGANNVSLSYTRILGSNILFDLFGGRYNETSRATPFSEDTPAYFDHTSGLVFARGAGCGDPDLLPDSRSVVFTPSCEGGVRVLEDGDRRRDQVRASASWFKGRHELKGGIDYRENRYSEISRGVSPYRQPLIDNVGTVVDIDGTEGAIFQLFDGFYTLFDFTLTAPGKTEELSFYIQDSWQASPFMTFNLGFRFNSLEATGKQTERSPDRKLLWGLDEMIAPRLGFVWDPQRNGRSKLFASVGRYYQSLPLNLNVIQFGEVDSGLHVFLYPFDGSTPTYDNLGLNVFSITFGSEGFVDPNVDPMYSDEAMLGFQYQVSPQWTLGISGVYKELGEAVEDISVDGGATYYVTNPGGTYTTNPVNGEPLLEPVVYPNPKRIYRSVELTFNRRYAGRWQMSGSYVYSESYGNYGGLFNQDIGQASPNLNIDFDSPIFSAEGPLPNDRPHNLKIFGTYRTPISLVFGFEGRYLSGRPLNKRGFEPVYFDSLRLIDGRGSGGRLPAQKWIDLHMQYPIRLGGRWELNLIADVFNVTNQQETTWVDEIWTYEVAEETTGVCGGPGTGPGTSCPSGNPDWGNELGWRFPRGWRIGMRVLF